MQQKARQKRLIGISNVPKASVLAMKSPAPFVPNYEAVALRFAQPMPHGYGLCLRTNPAVVGSPEAPVVFANVIQSSGSYYVSGPAFPADGQALMRQVVAGGKAAVEAHNNQQRGGQKIYTVGSEAEALTLIWGLLTAHYGIKDAAAQVEHYQRQQATERHQQQEASRAALELAERSTKLVDAQRAVEICEARQASDRQYYRSRQKEAQRIYPYAQEQAQRDAYCAEAKGALTRAIERTTQAQELLYAAEQPAPRTKLEAAQQLVSLAYVREARARQQHSIQCSEAREVFPLASQQAERDKYSAPAFAALQKAVQVTTKAGEALAALSPAESLAAVVPVGAASRDWIPDYPQAGEVGGQCAVCKGSQRVPAGPPAESWETDFCVACHPQLGRVQEDDHDQDSQEYPSDDDGDFVDDGQAEAIGDLYNSQWE